MLGVNPYIAFKRNCRQAIEFYRSALGAKVVSAGDGNISPAIGLNDPGRAAQLFDSLGREGTILMPLAKTYWAEAFGMVTDRFGVKLVVNCDAPK